MICTTLNDLYYVEWFVLRWMIWTTLNDLNYVEWYVQSWKICTTLKDLYYVEWFVLLWMICTTLNDLNYVEWYVQSWMICTALNDLYYVEWIRSAMNALYNSESFGIRWIIEYQLSMNTRCAYSRKYCKIFYTNLLVVFFCFFSLFFFSTRRNIFDPAPEIGHKEMFLITLVETIINGFSRHI